MRNLVEVLRADPFGSAFVFFRDDMNQSRLGLCHKMSQARASQKRGAKDGIIHR